jgi:hypothetical protein
MLAMWANWLSIHAMLGVMCREWGLLVSEFDGGISPPISKFGFPDLNFPPSFSKWLTN